MRGGRLIIAALVLAAAACGGSAGDDAAPQSEPSLDSYFGFDANDPEAAAARSLQLEHRRQELVASCMAEAGFEYIPAVNPGLGVVTFRDAATEEEEARNRGFGVSIRDDRTPDRPGPEWANPNDAIWEGLSGSEREAYEAALWGAETVETAVFVEEQAADAGPPLADGTPSAGGESVQVAEPAGEEEPAAVAEEAVSDDFRASGCDADAAREIYEVDDRLFRELQPGLEEMNQRVTADPRVAEAAEGWTRCMSDRGYPYRDEDELYQKGLTDLETRYRALVPVADPFAGWSEEEIERFWAESSGEQVDDFFAAADLRVRQEADQEALAALQQEERDLASANFACSQERDAIWNAVRVEYETRFIRDNREVLEQVRESASGTDR